MTPLTPEQIARGDHYVEDLATHRRWELFLELALAILLILTFALLFSVPWRPDGPGYMGGGR